MGNILSRLPLLVISALSATLLLCAIPQLALANTGPENRLPNNSAETNARNKCVSEGWQTLRYGAIWITESPTNYYDARVNITSSQNSVTVYIAGSVFGCHNTSTGNTYAVQVAPQGANGYRLTNLSSTSLFRGASQGAHNWSTQGGRITATLDVSGIATNNQNGPATQTFNIELYRCFSTNSSSATGSCFPETVPITVTRAQASAATWTLEGTTFVDRNFAKPGESALFTHDIENLGPDDSSGWGLPS